MTKPGGYTSIDILSATAIIFVITFVIVMIANPFQKLAKENDKQRGEDVKNLTELLLQLQFEDPEKYDALVSKLSVRPSIIGTASACDDGYGANCSEESASRDCIDLSFLPEELPIDPSGEPFSKLYTGYYLSIENDALTVGSCGPELQDKLEIISEL